MKKLFVLLMLSATVFSSVNAQSKKVGSKKGSSSTQTVYMIDKEATKIKWTGKKVGGSHTGYINVQDGTILANGSSITGGNIVIDMNSITCEDIKDADYNAKLIGHLKNEDFFNTAAFPQAMLNITKIASTGKGGYRLTGNLTIKGITAPITFNAKATPSGNTIKGTATIVFDRTKYDVKYGSTLFGAAADKAIENNVKLEISFVANKN